MVFNNEHVTLKYSIQLQILAYIICMKVDSTSLNINSADQSALMSSMLTDPSYHTVLILAIHTVSMVEMFNHISISINCIYQAHLQTRPKYPKSEVHHIFKVK